MEEIVSVGERLSLGWLDGAILAVLCVAMLRGLFIGLIRESFSIAAICAAVMTARLATTPVAAWLEGFSGGEVGGGMASWLAGSVIAIGTIVVVAKLGRILRRGARVVGLGWADRIGGAALGAAEGVVVGLALVLGATLVLGREHPSIERSRGAEAYEVVRAYVQEGDEPGLPSVAAPGRVK
jgi:membrane protein required for colicin V production